MQKCNLVVSMNALFVSMICSDGNVTPDVISLKTTHTSFYDANFIG